MGSNSILSKYSWNKLVVTYLLFTFIITGAIDALMNGKSTYSKIMGMDTERVYFYTFFLLVIGCWILYYKWISGIGFISLATFSSYFSEFILIHNYFASIAIYIGILIDVITRKKYKWLIPLIAIGSIQGLAFYTGWFGANMVGVMEFIGFCVGSVFIISETK
jgi:hypothetical protein